MAPDVESAIAAQGAGDRPGLIGLALDGGDLPESLLRRATRSMSRSTPEIAAQIRAEVKTARVASRAGDVDASVHRIAGLAESLLNSGSPELAAVLCGVGVNLARTLAATLSADDPELLAGTSSLHNLAGLIAMRTGLYPAATNCFEQAHALAISANDRSMVAATALNMSNTARVADDFESADRYARTALRLYEELQDPRGQIQLLQTLGSIAVETGEVDQAEDWVARASVLLRGHRDPGLTSSNHHLRGRIHVLRGDLEAAEHSLRLAVDAARRARDVDKSVAALQSWSAVASDAHRPIAARRRLVAAADLAEQGHLWWRLQLILPSLVRLHVRAGHKADALSAARRLVEVARDAGRGIVEAQALLGASLVDNELLTPGIDELESAWDSLAAPAEVEPETREHLLHNLIVAHDLRHTLLENVGSLAERAKTLGKDSAADALQQLGLSLAAEVSTAAPTARAPEQVGAILLESLRLRTARRRTWPALLMASRLEELGQHVLAIPLLKVALTAARRTGQETLTRRVRNDLGLALVETGEHDAALKLFQQNVDAASGDEDLETIRLAEFNRSETYRRLGHEANAEAAARAALHIAEGADSRDDLADARLQVALTLIDQDNLDDAESLLTLVIDLEAGTSDSATRAAALSSLGNIALGRRQPTEASDLYRRALRVGERQPKGKAETLLGLCEALAASNSRRPYTRALQRAIDTLTLVPYDIGLASRFLRCAVRWHENGHDSFAAEAVAAGILVGAAQVNEDEDKVDESSPLVIGLGVALGALRPDGPLEAAPAFMKLVEGRLRENVSRQSARALMEFVRDNLRES